MIMRFSAVEHYVDLKNSLFVFKGKRQGVFHPFLRLDIWIKRLKRFLMF